MSSGSGSAIDGHGGQDAPSIRNELTTIRLGALFVRRRKIVSRTGNLPVGVSWVRGLVRTLSLTGPLEGCTPSDRKGPRLATRNFWPLPSGPLSRPRRGLRPEHTEGGYPPRVQGGWGVPPHPPTPPSPHPPGRGGRGGTPPPVGGVGSIRHRFFQRRRGGPPPPLGGKRGYIIYIALVFS